MFKRDLDLEKRWAKLLDGLENSIGKKPKDLNGVLFLIGVQELDIAICKVLSYAGFYASDFVDQEGWPHWKLLKELPHFDLLEQEKLLKLQVMEYFEKEYQVEL